MWPALTKQGTSHQRHLADIRFCANQQCRLVWAVIINCINTFNLSRTCYKKTKVNHLSILHATSIRPCLPFRVWTK